ncbi:DENN domain-containing protein isoform 2 [Hibiscus syriacus]|uniref:DENN domain-containing protein isoform 2 n=1 Tax=Hibiscus syriacus TaxID=106335 RepID=A0A6A2XIZ6_HIBSY|nr:DENN domain-containing protein isoform 2 [Hibiscus syriacus]
MTTRRCYCILSRLPCFELHFGVLNRLERLAKSLGDIDLELSDSYSNEAIIDEALMNQGALEDMQNAKTETSEYSSVDSKPGGTDDGNSLDHQMLEGDCYSNKVVSRDTVVPIDLETDSFKIKKESTGAYPEDCDTDVDEFATNKQTAERHLPNAVLPFLRYYQYESSESSCSFQGSPCDDRNLRSDVDDTETEEVSISGQEDSSDHLDILEWAKVKNHGSLQILCEYYRLKCPARDSKLRFHPLEHLHPLEYHRPDEQVLHIAGSTIELRSCGTSLEFAEVLTIFSGSLLEKQIVVVCSNLGILSAIVLSIVPLICPYQWQSLLMPVLPDDMLDFLDAPVPYMMKASTIPQLPQHRELFACLSPYHAKLVGESYLGRKRPVYECTDVQVEAAKGFLSVLRSYLDSLCSNMRSHTITNVQSNNDKVSLLLKESFIDSFPSRDRPFMKLFVDTQLFTVHTDLVLSFIQKDRRDHNHPKMACYSVSNRKVESDIEGKIESMGWKIVGGADDFEIEAETRKQPKSGYMYFYMAECKRVKEYGTQSGSVTKDVRSKWNSMSDAEKEPYITQSMNDSKEYKERRKAHENKEVSTRCSIKRVNSLIKHLKEKGQLNVLGEIGFGSLVGVRNRPIRRELCRSLMAQFDVRQCIAKYGDFSFPLGIPCAAAVLGVTYAEIEEEIKSGSYVGDELKARVLLYLVGIFLCPTGHTSTNKEHMKLICDEGLKGEFNWAEYIHSRLIESIITFKKGSQRYLKGCIAILEVALFDFWSGCEAVPAYERTGVARIRVWGKEEVVRVMVKLKLDRAKKQERVIGKDVEEAEEKKGEMVVLGDDGEWDDVEEKLDRVEEKLERVEDTLERHKGVVEGKIDGVVKEVEVLRGEVVKEVGGVVDKYLDEGDQLKGGIKEMKSYVEKKYDELKKYEEEKREDEEEEMEEMMRKEVDVIYTPESVIAADLDSECPAPQKKKQKVEKADISSGIDDIEAAICDYLWNSELESEHSVISMGNQFASVYDVATLKPTEWVGRVVIDLLTWTVCYDSQKSLRRIGYLPYHLAQQALDANRKESVESIATFWGPILNNYVKFTDCEKIMITINYHNSHWYLLVLDMVDRVATIYDSMFTTEAAKQRVKDAKRLVVGEWDRSRILNDLG